MKSVLTLIVTLFLLPSFYPGNAFAQLEISLSADKDGIREFYLAIGEHYKAPEKEIVVVRERGISSDEIPVVFFIARKAKVDPETIINLRLKGKSWMNISLSFGLTAEVFYVESKKDYGPPYGKAYGHFKNKPRKEWNIIRLPDGDIVNFVNLKFISDYHGYSTDEIIKMRSAGEKFVKINGKVKKTKGHGKAGKHKVAVKHEKQKARGKKK